MAITWNWSKKVEIRDDLRFKNIAAAEVMSSDDIGKEVGIDDFDAVADYVAYYAMKVDKTDNNGRRKNFAVTLTTRKGWEDLVFDAKKTVEDYGRDPEELVRLTLPSFCGEVKAWCVVAMAKYFERSYRTACLPEDFKQALKSQRTDRQWQNCRRQWHTVCEGGSVDNATFESDNFDVTIGKHTDGKLAGYGWYISAEGRIMIRSNIKRLKARHKDTVIYHTGYTGSAPSVRDLIDRVVKQFATGRAKLPKEDFPEYADGVETIEIPQMVYENGEFRPVGEAVA